MPESLAALDAAPRGAPGRPSEWPFPVLQLVREAKAAPTEKARAEVAGRLNRLLDALGRGGGSREVADVFHGLLDRGALEGLVDAQGRSCHEAAVEGLLALGFPYALEVRPEDLAHLRDAPAPALGSRWRAELPSLLALLTGVLGQLGLEAWQPEPTERYPVTLLAVTLFAWMGVLLGGPGSALRRLGVGVGVVASLLGVLLSLLPGYAGLVAGLAGLLAAFLAARQGD